MCHNHQQNSAEFSSFPCLFENNYWFSHIFLIKRDFLKKTAFIAEEFT